MVSQLFPVESLGRFFKIKHRSALPLLETNQGLVHENTSEKPRNFWSSQGYILVWFENKHDRDEEREVSLGWGAHPDGSAGLDNTMAHRDST